MKIGFLGLGLMGSGMVAQLLAADHEVTVYNRTAAKAQAVAEKGAHVASTPAEAAANAEVIISMVADDNVSRELWLGANGALAAAPAGTILVESSTVTVGWIEELAAAAKARSLELIDAPVTGSKVQAATGQLLFLAGGSAEAVAAVTPVLRSMGRDVVPLGPSGSGARMKLINNFLCGVQVAALAESIAMIERGGLDPARAVSLLTEGAPGSPLVKGVSDRMMRHDFSVNFLLRLMAKDLRYAGLEAARSNLTLATGNAALAVFQSAIAAGNGEQDIAAIVEQFR